MTKSVQTQEPVLSRPKKRAPKNYPKLWPNHDSHQFVGARDFDPVLDVPNDETEERRELEPWLRVIEPPERGRPQISIRRSLNSGDFEALFVLELASVVATGFGAAEQWHRTTTKIPPSDMVRNRYFRSLFSRLRTGQSIQFAHRGGRDESGDVVISSRIIGSSISSSLERAVETINTLFDNLMLALSADAANYRYVPSKALVEIEPSARLWRGSVRP